MRAPIYGLTTPTAIVPSADSTSHLGGEQGRPNAYVHQNKLAIAAVAVGLACAPTAAAHNAAHIVMPDGTCHQVGSFKPVLTGQDKTPLDLIPETQGGMFDEFGTSYAAFQGATPLLPGPC